MRLILFILAGSLFLTACQPKAIVPAKLIGEWNPTYQIQERTTDGTWGPWTTISTFAALPSIEFTADGRFLREGKEGADCCYAGNRFTVSDNTIFFTEFKSCPQVRCANCTTWQINRLEADTLVIEACDIGPRSKYARKKK
ncbi:hypothetical protein [Emticicia sp. 17c]|uniref:hypothetical protein n=1 Tax=Emticicia sp. 17c TaxID=3127704 RepID=UPI00301C385C